MAKDKEISDILLDELFEWSKDLSETYELSSEEMLSDFSLLLSPAAFTDLTERVAESGPWSSTGESI